MAVGRYKHNFVLRWRTDYTGK